MSIQEYLTTADYHTGTQCLLLPAGSSAGPMLSLVPADQDRCYVFSCWARTLSSYVPSAGHVAQWTNPDVHDTFWPDWLTEDIPETAVWSLGLSIGIEV